MSLAARYPGTPCEQCGEPIRVGDQIEGADPGWQHTTCPDPLDTDNRQPCPDCFLIHLEGKCDR